MTINVSELLPHLLQSRCLTEADKEKIDSTQQRNGQRAAAFVLIDCIPRHQEDWCALFMHALKKTGSHGHIIEEIGPTLNKLSKLNFVYWHVKMKSSNWTWKLHDFLILFHNMYTCMQIHTMLKFTVHVHVFWLSNFLHCKLSSGIAWVRMYSHYATCNIRMDLSKSL